MWVCVQRDGEEENSVWSVCVCVCQRETRTKAKWLADIADEEMTRRERVSRCYLAQLKGGKPRFRGQCALLIAACGKAEDG